LRAIFYGNIAVVVASFKPAAAPHTFIHDLVSAGRLKTF
jgi:hypothetical protein